MNVLLCGCVVVLKSKALFLSSGNQLKMCEEGLWAEIKDAEIEVTPTVEKCTDMKRRIPEIQELEKNQKQSR